MARLSALNFRKGGPFKTVTIVASVSLRRTYFELSRRPGPVSMKAFVALTLGFFLAVKTCKWLVNKALRICSALTFSAR